MEIPDKLYRQVKAKSALEGRPIRAVAIELFRGYVGLDEPPESESPKEREEKDPLLDDRAFPPWFGILRAQARRTKRHDMASVRESLARGIAEDRRL